MSKLLSSQNATLNDNGDIVINLDKPLVTITRRSYNSVDEYLKDIHDTVYNTLMALVSEARELQQGGAVGGLQPATYTATNPLPGNGPAITSKGINSANAGSFSLQDITSRQGGSGLPYIKNFDWPTDKDKGSDKVQRSYAKKKSKTDRKENNEKLINQFGGRKGKTSAKGKKDVKQKQSTKPIAVGVPPEDEKVIKTPSGGYINIPDEAIVELFGTNRSATTSANISIAIDPNATRLFTVKGNRYIADFDTKKGNFTGYVLDKDMKTEYVPDSILYQNKVSQEFKNKLLQITYDLKQDPNKLMAVMAQETGETFRADIWNGTLAVGLIQFTAKAIEGINDDNGTDYTMESISKMPATQQLDLVEKFYQQPLLKKKTLKNLEDYAVATFSPADVGKGADNVIYDKNSKNAKNRYRYNKNKGLDTNKDGKITNGEVGSKYKGKYVKE